mgnify:FL=1
MLYKIRLLYLSGKSRNEKLATTALSPIITSFLFGASLAFGVQSHFLCALYNKL